MDFGAALIGLVISFVTKVIIMAWALRLLLRSYSSLHASPSHRPWLLIPTEDRGRFKTLYWSLIFFFLSEIVCGIEIYVVMQTSELYRALHTLTSATGMSLFALGMYELVDARVVHYGSARCVLNRVCHGCEVIKGGTCGFRAAVLITATLLVLAAIPPQFADTSWMHAQPQRWLLPFPSLNAWYDTTVVPWLATLPGYKPVGVAFFLPQSTQILDFRVMPAIAAALAAAGGLLYWRGRIHLGLKLIVLSAGPLAYAYYELILNRVTGDLFLGALGHEVGEFLFLVLVAEVLTRFFRPKPVNRAVKAEVEAAS